MRLSLAALNCAKGDIPANLGAHLELVRGAGPGDLVLFPEMSLTGSVDLPAHPERLIPLDHPAVTAIARATAGGPAACFGIGERGPANAPCITQVVAAGHPLAPRSSSM